MKNILIVFTVITIFSVLNIRVVAGDDNINAAENRDGTDLRLYVLQDGRLYQPDEQNNRHIVITAAPFSLIVDYSGNNPQLPLLSDVSFDSGASFNALLNGESLAENRQFSYIVGAMAEYSNNQEQNLIIRDGGHHMWNIKNDFDSFYLSEDGRLVGKRLVRSILFFDDKNSSRRQFDIAELTDRLLYVSVLSIEQRENFQYKELDRAALAIRFETDG